MAINSSDVGFEKQIWDAACVLRGNLDASEYKSVVLGFALRLPGHTPEGCLPPLAEQKCIVAKLEELLPLCERLK